jgi:leader peptidase (prepilin peptidase)/N-methyltransferase
MAELLTQAPTVFIAVAFAFALIIGSFLNVIIYRLPLMMQRDWREQCDELSEEPAPDLPEGKFNLVVPRSRCPSCGAAIKAWQNIPVLSYLLLGAQCSNCQKSISVRYPLVETMTAILAAICAWHFGFGWEALMAIGLSFALVATSLIDADHQIIPDSIVIPLMWAGLIMSLFHPRRLSQPLERLPAIQAHYRQGRHGIRRLQIAGGTWRLARLAGSADDHPDVRGCRRRNRYRIDRLSWS